MDSATLRSADGIATPIVVVVEGDIGRYRLADDLPADHNVGTGPYRIELDSGRIIETMPIGVRRFIGVDWIEFSDDRSD